MIRALVAATILAAPTFAAAEVLEIQPVTDGVWAVVGEKDQRSPENLANNATFGLVVTADGAVLIDPGGSWKGAEALHDIIRSITDQPVT
jgi:glyoxylase-like metal-dependent hydrolase (beta-lactamase superfamily II)